MLRQDEAEKIHIHFKDLAMNRSDFMMRTKLEANSARKEKKKILGETPTFKPEVNKKSE